MTLLGLSSNQIRDLSPLAGLTNLIQLILDGNQISDLSPLKGLTNLILLSLDDNQISDLSPLEGLTNLTELYFSSTSKNHICLVKPESICNFEEGGRDIIDETADDLVEEF